MLLFMKRSSKSLRVSQGGRQGVLEGYDSILKCSLVRYYDSILKRPLTTTSTAFARTTSPVHPRQTQTTEDHDEMMDSPRWIHRSKGSCGVTVEDQERQTGALIRAFVEYRKSSEERLLATADSILRDLKNKNVDSFDHEKIESQLKQIIQNRKEIKTYEDSSKKELNFGFDMTMESRYASGVFISGLSGVSAFVFNGVFAIGILVGYYFCFRMINARAMRDSGLKIMEENHRRVQQLKVQNIQLTTRILQDLEQGLLRGRRDNEES